MFKIFTCYFLCRNMSVFTQHLNPITGVQTWVKKDENYDYHQEVARSAFADMLHDHERNEKYYIALKAAIEKMHKAGKEANVLDIGTGTGLLSMMAAKCGADSITACEAFKPMATCAAKIIRENNLDYIIKLVYKRSNSLTVGENGDMKKRANILVTEVFDTELIGEGALSTFRHAHQELLENDCIVVPSCGTVWAQVVHSPLVQLWNRVNVIRDPETNEVLIDSSVSNTCSGVSVVHDIQLSRLPRNSFTPLLEPLPIFRFDWSGKEPLMFDETKQLSAKAIASGTAHAVFMWWDLNMDTEGKVLLSCAPVWEHPDVKSEINESTNFEKLADKIPWRDHWMQAVYYPPMEATITLNDEVTLIGSHDEYSFWFYVNNQTKIPFKHHEKPYCECCIHLAFARTRIGQFNDHKRNEEYIRALRTKNIHNSTCLCISDSSVLGLSMVKLGAKKLIILETNYLSQRTIETFIASNDLSEKVQVITSMDQLPPNDEIDFIFGEPYFVTSLLPWDNIRFWYIISKYPDHITRMPLSLTIRAVAMEFKDLYKIRAPLGICSGFDMTIFDKLVEDSSNKSDSPVEAQPLWEYPGRALSSAFVLGVVDLTKDVKSHQNIRISDNIHFAEDGVCNGVAIWADWQLNEDTVISSGPLEDIVPGKRISWDPYTRQGVHLLRKMQKVKKGDTLECSINFSPEDGQFQFHFKII